MITYLIVACILLLIGVLAITDRYNPAIQFSFITGLGFLFLYDDEYIEEEKQITLQLMFGTLLITITYMKPNAGNII